MTGRYLEKLRGLSADSSRIVDKMPSNAFEVGLLKILFPSCRIILCTRDPRDICLSCYTRNFAHGHRFSWNLNDLGHYYRHYARVAAHWKAVIPGLYEVQYERLIEDPEPVAREMISVLGLEWSERCLEFHTGKSRVKTNPYSVRRPIYSSSVARWKQFEPWIGELQFALNADGSR